MSRAARRQNVGVALFPFLAVLICTMGALIVLLVLLVQQARVDASTIAERHATAAESPQLRERLEDAQWRRDTLAASRAEKSQELADSRGKLAHLEDHLQRLQERAKELMERARLIDEGSELRADDLDVVRDEIERVQAEAREQKKKIDDAKANANKESWYALIPYDGPQGTRRRPIYLECTGEGVVIQPEGLVLRAQDFQGPLGPGNPLDAALRMIRSHLESVHGTKAGQPYPLVVVRPSGVAAYGAARSALKSWDDEFGYELIGDDKRLDFGAPDPALATALDKTVAVARQKQAVMVAMMPRSYQNEEPLQSFADALPAAPNAGAAGGSGIGTGGRVAAGAAGMGSSAASGAGLAGDAAAMAGGRSGAYGAGPAGSDSASGAGTSGGGSPGPAGVGPGGSAASNGGMSASGPALGSPGGSASGGATGGAERFSTSGQAAAGTTTGTSAGNMPGSSANSAMGRPSPPGGTPGGAGGGGAFAPSQAGGTPVPNLPIGQASANSSTSSSASSSGSGGSKTASSKSGKSRGRNWALTEAKPHSIGVTRPLYVAVHTDRLLIVPDRGDSRPPVVVPISPELRADDVNHFVTAVQNEVKGWGLAVANGYWKPVLHVGVAPGAELQFAELQTALEGSGYDILRK